MPGRACSHISLFYAASFGSIQRALQQLEAKGWVETLDAEDSRRRNKLRLITEPGRAAWRAWMHEPISGSDAEPTILARVSPRSPAEERTRRMPRRGAEASAR